MALGFLAMIRLDVALLVRRVEARIGGGDDLDSVAGERVGCSGRHRRYEIGRGVPEQRRGMFPGLQLLDIGRVEREGARWHRLLAVWPRRLLGLRECRGTDGREAAPSLW